MPTFDPATTALVLIDLQNGIVGMDLAPLGGDAVVLAAKDLAARFRAAGATVVLVHVDFANGLAPSQNVDRPLPTTETPPGWSDIVDDLARDGDVVVTKHHWGAFIGTDLDLQLRRRNVRTVVLGGIATNMGVESTARSGWELGYDLVLVEDVMSSRNETMHRFAVDTIFPQIGRVVASRDIVLA